VVIANFAARKVPLTLPRELANPGTCLIWNYEPVDTLGENVDLKPYEAFAILCEMRE